MLFPGISRRGEDYRLDLRGWPGFRRNMITGTLPGACFAAGMTKILRASGIRIFDYSKFAAALRDRVRETAAALTTAAELTIEHIAKSYIRKEEVVTKVLAARGRHPGLVHVISAMEPCDASQPWHDKQTHRTFLRPDSGKCLHYYFYFMDADLGLIHRRVPTWSPSASRSTAAAIAGLPASWPLALKQGLSTRPALRSAEMIRRSR